MVKLFLTFEAFLQFANFYALKLQSYCLLLLFRLNKMIAIIVIIINCYYFDCHPMYFRDNFRVFNTQLHDYFFNLGNVMIHCCSSSQSTGYL